MKCDNVHRRLIKKARKSSCRAKIAAIGIDHVGRVIGCTHNKPHLPYKGAGFHAEMLLMRRSPRSLKTIIIARVSDRGNLRPISPCDNCSEEADKRGIKIISLRP